MSDAKIKEQLRRLFGETARWLRVPSSVVAAGGIATVIAALTHTALLDVTGTVAGVAALTGTIYAVWRRKKILRQYRDQMNEKRQDLARAVEISTEITPLTHSITKSASRSPRWKASARPKPNATLPLRDQIEALEQKIGAIKANRLTA